MDDLRVPDCPICGTDGKEFREHDSYYLRCCGNPGCGHVWVANIPDEAELAWL